MPQDLVILMSIALAYLLSLPLTLVYFLHITLLRLEIKNSSMKNRINHQNNVIWFRSNLYNKWVTVIVRKHLKTYWGWAAHNHRSCHSRQNIFKAKGSRCRTAECITCIYDVCIHAVLACLLMIKNLCNKWIVLIGRKTLRTPLRMDWS